ncbi:hypothetical protein J536_1774 [Acinetobacter sp. 809848]|nr:hypothetical protein J536_1774 [Acinetobacter sp. 809848]
MYSGDVNACAKYTLVASAIAGEQYTSLSGTTFKPMAVNKELINSTSVNPFDFLSVFIRERMLASTLTFSATCLWLLAFNACNMSDSLLLALAGNSFNNLLMVQFLSG